MTLVFNHFYLIIGMSHDFHDFRLDPIYDHRHDINSWLHSSPDENRSWLEVSGAMFCHHWNPVRFRLISIYIILQKLHQRRVKLSKVHYNRNWTAARLIG